MVAPSGITPSLIEKERSVDALLGLPPPERRPVAVMRSELPMFWLA
jgi:hypothetical protein